MLVAYASLKDYFPLDTESWGMVISGSTYVLLATGGCRSNPGATPGVLSASITVRVYRYY